MQQYSAERLATLRKVMEEQNIDYYMIPTADFHFSEYVSDYFKTREYFSNFTGSNGTLLVWKEGAGLWTDGRYFIQAEKELQGTGITLFRMLEPGVPTLEAFLLKQMKEGQTLGFDGRLVSAKTFNRLKEKLAGIIFSADKDLAEAIWKDRPAFPKGTATALTDEITGMSTCDKMALVREEIHKEGADSLFLSKLDDIMWLFNIRGCDVACNPVAMSYAYLDDEKAVLFLQKQAVEKQVALMLKEQGIQLEEYAEVFSFLERIDSRKVLIDIGYTSASIYQTLQKKNRLIDGKNPTEGLKAVKNSTEIENMRKVYLADSVAVTKFIYWLKNTIGKEELTEVSAAEYLDNLRREIPGFLDLSFPTISGYRENAAMMHYEATPEKHAKLKPEGMLLVDSGGQYLGGTTDVTRTIVLGPVSEEERLHYTVTAMGMLRLANAVFPEGCTGRNLDILAREAIWNLGIDYLCGTGHGIGYILNVHEGPQGIRWRYNKDVEEAILREGMVVTDEPGVYVEGKYGIRIENVLLVEKLYDTEYGKFLHFEQLTYVPIDMEAVDESILPDDVRDQLYTYQRKVYDLVGPYLTNEEREWLKKATRAEGSGLLRDER